MATDATPTREFSFLTRCVREAVVGRGDAERGAVPDQSPDWGALLSLAEAHGVLPLVVERLAARPGYGIPDDTLERLETRVQMNTRRNVYFAGELLQLLNRFQTRGIRVVPVKGPVLAQDVYGSLSRRTFGDIDLLFDRSEWPQVHALMRSEGFRIDADRVPEQKVVPDGSIVIPPGEFRFVREEDDILVELRCRLGERVTTLDLSFDQLWTRRTQTTLLGTEVPRLSPADRLVVLGHHGTKHRWAILKWVADLAAFATAEGSSCADPLEGFARSTKRSVLLGVRVVDELLDIEVTAELARRAREDATVRSLAEAHLGLVTNNPTGTIPKHSKVRHELRRGGLVRSLPEFVSWLLRPSMVEYELVPLPSRYHFLYFFLRPVRLASDGVGEVVSRYVRRGEPSPEN